MVQIARNDLREPAIQPPSKLQLTRFKRADLTEDGYLVICVFNGANLPGSPSFPVGQRVRLAEQDHEPFG